MGSKRKGWTRNAEQGYYLSPNGIHIVQKEHTRRWTVWEGRLGAPHSRFRLVADHWQTLESAQEDAERMEERVGE